MLTTHVSLVPIKKKIESKVKSLQVDYNLTDEGDFLNYLSTRFDCKPDVSVSLTQLRMIERVLKLVGFDEIEQNVTRHDTLATTILDKDPERKPRI